MEELRDTLAIEVMKIILVDIFKNRSFSTESEFKVFETRINGIGENCYNIADKMISAKKHS